MTRQVAQEMPQTEKKRWVALRFVMLVPIMLFVGFIPWMAFAGRVFGHDRDGFLLGFMIYAIPYLASGFVSATWPCPNCSKPFNRRGRFGVVLPYRSACTHCGARGATSN
jgi:hypothetical protein